MDPEDVKNGQASSSDQGTQTPQDKTDVNKSSDPVDQIINPDNQANPPDSQPGKVELLLDEDGVPLQNRTKEYQRKLEKTTSELSELKTMVAGIQKSMTNNQEYTIEDLERFKKAQPEHSEWCDKEIKKLRDKEVKSLVTEGIQEFTSAQQAKEIKSKSIISVAQAYPNLVLKDEQGRIKGWNMQDPMMGIINGLMQDPDLKKRPDSLRIAADIAFARIAKSKMHDASQKNLELKSTITDLKNKTLIEGDGVNAQPVPQSALKKSVNQAKVTGDKKDVQAAIGNILHESGFFK